MLPCLKKPDTTRTELPMRISVTQPVIDTGMGGVRRVLDLLQGQVGGDDQRPAAAVSAVNDAVNLFQPVFCSTLHAEIVQNQQRITAEPGDVLVPALKAGGKVIEDCGKVRHADGDFFLHQGVCNTARKVAFAGSYTAPKEIADVLGLHGVPMLRIEPGNSCLGVPAVVVFKSPVTHGGIEKSPAFQVLYGVKVSALLFGSFTLNPLRLLAVALCRVAAR